MGVVGLVDVVFCMPVEAKASSGPALERRVRGLQAVEDVTAELQRLLPACLPPPVLRYARLQQRMTQCIHAALAKRAREASQMVSSLLDIELAYLNTSHPDFVGGTPPLRAPRVVSHFARFPTLLVPCNALLPSSSRLAHSSK